MLLLHRIPKASKERHGKRLLVILGLAILVALALPLVTWLQLQRLSQLACSNGSVTTDACSGKIWAHRVNSIKRAAIVHDQFAGFETDIVWDAPSASFLVYHPPLKGKVITLDSFLSTSGNWPSIWFDTRSDRPGDSTLMLAAFQNLEQYYGLKQKTILELYEMDLANHLAAKGYKVALNISPEWIEHYSTKQWDSLKTAMSKTIAYVAQEAQYVDELEKLFPGMQIITWSTSIRNYFDLSHLKALVNNKRISVVLVNVKSRHYQ